MAANIERMISRLAVFPLESGVNDRGHLVIGGYDSVALAEEYGTPLYVFDELTLRTRIAQLKAEFGQRHSDTSVIYACKAFLNQALAKLLMEEGLGLDVVSGGEISIARSVGFPLERAYFHGNNKSAEELALALESGVGRILVDNFHELRLLGTMASAKGRRTDILLRLSPGVDPHTHRYTITGNVDSKFGFPLAQGEDALTLAMSLPSLNVVGLHCHIGSLIFEVEPYVQAVRSILDFAGDMKRRHGFELGELDVGGGFGVRYTLDEPDMPIADFAGAITAAVAEGCRALGLGLPHLVVEPGRWVVGQAGVALYTVGAMKDIPGVRRYVSVDGGMADNIRPALYGSKLEAVIANRMRDEIAGEFTIAGKFCESGDILVRDIALPEPVAGDVVAVAVCGAYSLPQASNYNAALKPAIVLVKEGRARLIRRRETFDDLTRNDLLL